MKQTIASIALLLLCASSAYARNDTVEYDIAAALVAEHHENLLSDVPIFMKEQSHPSVTKTIGSFTANRPARSAMTSDESACHRAFLSAIISLQTRAKSEGGNAVIDIGSNTNDAAVTRAGKYRCVVGNIVARVNLSGIAVQLAEH